jgi:hypothetical protein
MSGKAMIAFVALAASTASAATATIVYHKIFQPKPGHSVLAEGAGALGLGHVKFAVMSNASEAFSGSLADSAGDSGSPSCRSGGASQTCVSSSRGSDVRLQILGSTPTFPPIWLGQDTEDLYTIDGSSLFRPIFEAPSPFGLGIQNIINQPSAQATASDQNASQTDGGQASNESNAALQISAPSLPFAGIPDRGFSIASVGQRGRDPLSALASNDASPPAEPLIDDFRSAIYAPPVASPFLWAPPPPTGGVTTPELSTWVMMLAGFACLGFSGCRASRKGIRLAA